MIFGIETERNYEKWQYTCYSSVLGFAGQTYPEQEGWIPDIVCAHFKERV